jgi:nickel-dependent lactate racemase
MKEVMFCYGKGKMKGSFEDGRLVGVLQSHLHEYTPLDTEENLVKEALCNPIGSPKLSEMARGKKNVVIIASDHTRPVPSKVIIPFMLEEIRKGSPKADITILIATGCHRGTTKDELVAKFGEKIVENEKIVVHDCLDDENFVSLGTLPGGGELIINKIAAKADLLCAEGFIEPHFFAGFSGGRKSVLPGIASRTTVLANHCSDFVGHENARTGILEGNPIHKDMLFAAKTANLQFIVNVVLGADKQVIYAVAGDCDLAHQAGVEFINKYARVDAIPADIAISTNGGYPLDQNIYQSPKGMTAAEATVKENGVVIMLASSIDGHGGQSLYDTFKNQPSDVLLDKKFKETKPNDTIPDQWQAQVLVRILLKHKVIYISEADDQMIRDFHMIPAHSIEEAMKIADEILGIKGTVTAIPDGISVIVRAK